MDIETVTKLISRSGLFDSYFYIKRYPDVVRSGSNPLEHFVHFGMHEMRHPSERFDPHWYSRYYEDVEKSDMNPLMHYILYGIEEGRYATYEEMVRKVGDFSMSIVGFDPDFLEPRTLEMGGELFEAIARGIVPFHRDFEPYDEKVYLESFPDVAFAVRAGVFPGAFDHFRISGYREIVEGRRYWKRVGEKNDSFPDRYPSVHDDGGIAGFDMDAYIDANASISESIRSGKAESAEEYLRKYGLREISEGRELFHGDFEPYDETLYITLNPDLSMALERGEFSSAFDHFRLFGYKEITAHVRSWIRRRRECDIRSSAIGPVDGSIVGVDRGVVSGWISSAGFVRPLLMADGERCEVVKIFHDSKDGRNIIRFEAHFPKISMETQEMTLYAVSGSRCRKVDTFTEPFVRPFCLDLVSSLERLYDIASKDKSILIVSGDFGESSLRILSTLEKALRGYGEIAVAGMLFGDELPDDTPIPRREAGSVTPLLFGWGEKEIVSLFASRRGIRFDMVVIVGSGIRPLTTARILSGEESVFLHLPIEERFTPQKGYENRARLYDRVSEEILSRVVSISEKPLFGEDGDISSEKLSEILESSLSRARTVPKSEIFTIPLLPSFDIFGYDLEREVLVLVWKQSDASLYGRRVDQIARKYRERYPSARVVVMEISIREDGLWDTEDPLSDASMVVERGWFKESLDEMDGVEYLMPGVRTIESPSATRHFLLTKGIVPSNSLFILFPFSEWIEDILPSLYDYDIVADIVDNRLGWRASEMERITAQYKEISLKSRLMIFNSRNNISFFRDNGLLESGGRAVHIANWYSSPYAVDGDSPANFKGVEGRYIIYSGDMNDRIDWELIEKLLYSIPKDTVLYLIGSAQRSHYEMERLLDGHENCIYLGPMDEKSLVGFVSGALFAIVPHRKEAVSRYMNPLKIYMYSSLGLESIVMRVDGLDDDMDGMVICDDHTEFVSESLKRIFLDEKGLYRGVERVDGYSGDGGERYMEIIGNIFAMKRLTKSREV